MTTAQDVVAEARTWLGTPFRHQGRLKGVGVDCIGVPGMVALALGIEGGAQWRAAADMHNYGPEPNPRVLLSGCERFLDRVPDGQMRVADILLMRFAKEPMHFSVLTALDPTAYVLHALSRIGKVCEHRLDAQWHSNVMRVYRLRGIE